MFDKLYKQYKNSKINYIESIKKEKTFKGKLKKQLPNILTKSRFIAPFIIVPISIYSLPIALITTILFALTDAFDGYFARKYNAYSEYGRLLDIVCDKVFAIGITLPILITNPLLMSGTIALELLITTINVNSARKNNNPKSSDLGKIKTVILSFNLILNYLSVINIPMILFTNIIQLITAIDYYNIDKKKDKLKNKISTTKTHHNFEEKQNNYEREKNELIELKKSLIPNKEKSNPKQYKIKM